MSRSAMWLGAGLAVGLLAGVLAGRHWAQLEAQAEVQKVQGRCEKVQQLLADAGERFELQKQQLYAVRRDGEKSLQRERELEVAVKAAKEEAEALRKARPKAGSDEALPPPPAATLNAPVIRVLEVKLPLRMLMVDVGAQGGMQAGMGFVVVHEKTPVAEVRAADVRETFTGMVIETVYAGQQPAPGDRLVVRRK
ncbi:MAG: hypothetical protein NTY53_00445 [Kiritimatiellaeota bacterium]|nr:hypothetical protein [Kiritimatiellota bacterium]